MQASVWLGRMKLQWISKSWMKRKWRKCMSEMTETWEVDKRASFSSCVLFSGTVTSEKQACFQLSLIWKLVCFNCCKWYSGHFEILPLSLSLSSEIQVDTNLVCFIFLGFWTVAIWTWYDIAIWYFHVVYEGLCDPLWYTQTHFFQIAGFFIIY